MKVHRAYKKKNPIMRKYILQLLTATAIFGIQPVFAGNPDRAGGAGATQLLINPYGRSAGLMGSNTGSVRGLESFQFNIGGLAYTQKTEVGYARTVYLAGTDVFINNFSLAQNLGSGNVVGLTFNSFDYGSIPITTESQPDGTLGTYSPQFLNIGLAFAKQFSNSITGGIDVRVVSEGASNVRASGIALSAGVQYQTSINPRKRYVKKEDFKFGIAIKNLGPSMQYSGSGLSYRALNPVTGADRRSYMGAEPFQMPALVNIGVSYDMRLDKKDSTTYNHRLTPHFNFNYNSFSANVTSIGLEYGFKETLMLRAGYAYQDKITSADEYRTQ
jgi:rRNA maturation protein Rpf1